MSLQTDVFLPSKLSDEDVAAWNSFNSETPNLSVSFLSHTYAVAAEKAFGNVHVCRVKRDGQVMLFFPFQYKSHLHKWFGIGQRIAGELSDHFGAVARAGMQIDPLALLRMSRLNALLFTHLDKSQSDFGLTGEAPECGHLIEFPNGGEAFWEERRVLDKKFVQDTERREKKLVRDVGPVSFSFDSGSSGADLEKLIAAKRNQYSRTGVDDVFANSSTRDFLSLLSKERHPQCSGILSTLYAGDVWVASHFGLRCHQTLHYWFPVYNPDLSSYGPGRLLIKKIIEAGAEHRISRIDRGAGDSAAKRDLSTLQQEYFRGIWYRNNIQASMYRAGLSVAWRLFSTSTRKTDI